MNKEEFYQQCAAIMGAESDYRPRKPLPIRYSHRTETWYQPMTNAGRFKGREPGNGRFAGLGTIHVFSPTCIRVALSNPFAMGNFDSAEATLNFLRTTFAKG